MRACFFRVTNPVYANTPVSRASLPCIVLAGVSAGRYQVSWAAKNEGWARGEALVGDFSIIRVRFHVSCNIAVT